MIKCIVRMIPMVSVFLLLFLLTGGQAFAERGNPLVEIGRCELPEDVAVEDGWDIDPAGGSWGGKSVNDFAVAWAPGAPDLPTMSGREAVCTIEGQPGMLPHMIRVHALNGLANDDYCVFVTIRGSDVRVGCYDEIKTTEEWITTDLDMPVKFLAVGQDVTVKIFVTGNSWSGFGTYGQLGVDYISIWGKHGWPHGPQGHGD